MASAIAFSDRQARTALAEVDAPMVDTVVTITEYLRKTFSLEAETIEHFTAHAVGGAILERDGHSAALALLNILYGNHIMRFLVETRCLRVAWCNPHV